MKRLDARDATALAIVLAFGVLLRAVLMLGSSGILWPDSSLFLSSARSILEGGPYRYNSAKTPLYSLFLAAFMAFGETHATGFAVILVQHLLGLASTAIFYVVARQVFDRKVAFFSSLLFSAHALLLFYEASVLSEILFVFLAAVLLHQALRVLSDPTPGRAALVGLLCAMGTLTRPVAQGFVVCIMAVVLFTWGRRRARQALTAAALMAVTFAAAVLPWMYVNSRNYGHWGVSLGGGFGLFIRVFESDRLDPVADTRAPQVKEALEWVRAHEGNSYHVRSRLRSLHRYSSLDLDRGMFTLAFETVRANPWAYTVNSARNWGRHLLSERADVHLCPGDTGPYLCSSRTTGKSTKMFPNVPAEGRRPLKEAIASWFSHGYTRMQVLVPLAFLGMLLSLFSKGMPRAQVILLIVAVLYFTGVPALIQWPEERYRLPVDPLLFMFAVSGVIAAVSGAARVLRRSPAGAPGPKPPAALPAASHAGSRSDRGNASSGRTSPSRGRR